LNSRAASVLSCAALLAVGGGVPGLPSPSTLNRRRRPKETIDDVLARAKSRADKPAFNPRLDGTVQR